MVEIVSFGYWVRRRRMALDLTQAALANRVGCATVTIKKIERDQRRPSRLMAERIAESLEISTEEREDFILTGLGEAPVYHLPVPSEPVHTLQGPSQTRRSSGNEDAPWDRFVGRETELNWLDEQLEATLSGNGRVAFIAGGAGRGKTALMEAFAQRALAKVPDLLVSGGSCSAFAGMGDPYLPFRDVMNYLTGEVAVNWGAGTQSWENARRVLDCLPATLQILAEHSPNLLEVFVPGLDVLARAKQSAPEGAPWLILLQEEVNRRRGEVGVLEQHALHGHMEIVLRKLSAQHPLMITLDDLHWADEASLALLFHLGRRLVGSRILILGAYRPEELAFDRESESHPLVTILGELKRNYGEVSIDLGAADRAEGALFVKDYLDSFPNQFSEDFYETLTQQTGGHPLFTVELLREMHERGDLVQDQTGIWQEVGPLDWEAMPALVGAVIAQRLDRLEENLRQVLTIASVEGESFTAEVVAEASRNETRLVLDTLSNDLTKRYRLVRERGEIFLKGRTLSPYQFSHALFQQYLYQQLDPGARRRLHRDVARGIEFAYREDVHLVAARLAWHFEEARDPEKAVKYLQMAGERAIHLAGFDEAISLLIRGLSILEAFPSELAMAEMQFEMQLSLADAQFKAGYNLSALASCEEAIEIADKLGSSKAYARAALAYEEFRWPFNLPASPVVDLERAFESIAGEESVLGVRLWTNLLRTRLPTMSREEFYTMSQKAIDMARRVNDPLALFEAIYLKVWGDRRPELSDERLALIAEGEALSNRLSSMLSMPVIHPYRLLERIERGEPFSRLEDELNLHREISTAIKRPFFFWAEHQWKSLMGILEGRFAEAEQLVEEAFQMGKKLSVSNVEGPYGIQMFTIRREQGRIRELAPIVELFVDQEGASAAWKPGLALIYSELDQRKKAQALFEEQAANDFEEIPRDSMWLICLAYLAEVCAYLGDERRAQILYHLLLPYKDRTIVAGFSVVCIGAAARFLGLLAATMSRWEVAEGHFKTALEINNRMGARPWLAHTQHLYAVMLLACSWEKERGKAQSLLTEALKTTRDLEMKALEDKLNLVIHQSRMEA